MINTNQFEFQKKKKLVNEVDGKLIDQAANQSSKSVLSCDQQEIVWIEEGPKVIMQCINFKKNIIHNLRMRLLFIQFKKKKKVKIDGYKCADHGVGTVCTMSEARKF